MIQSAALDWQEGDNLLAIPHLSTSLPPLTHPHTAQEWSKCVDMERDSGGDFAEECREKVLACVRECVFRGLGKGRGGPRRWWRR